MTLCRRRALATLAAGGAALALPRMARAQAWRPTQPIRIVVPFPPGGTNDLMARPLAEALRVTFGQPVVVENRSGAGGTIGSTQVSRAAPDGHTLLVTSAILVTAAILQPVGWTAVDGFTPIAQIARSPNAVAVHAGLPVRTVQDLIAHARARPGEVNYGSVGIGSLGHFMTEALSLQAGIRMTHVPYRGGGAAVTDLASGQLQLLVSTPPPILGLAREGKVRIIAYTSEGEAAPPGPAPILRTLNEAANAALRGEEFTRLLRAEGAIPTPLTPEEFAATVRAEDARWREVARAANIQL